MEQINTESTCTSEPLCNDGAVRNNEGLGFLHPSIVAQIALNMESPEDAEAVLAAFGETPWVAVENGALTLQNTESEADRSIWSTDLHFWKTYVRTFIPEGERTDARLLQEIKSHNWGLVKGLLAFGKYARAEEKTLNYLVNPQNQPTIKIVCEESLNHLATGLTKEELSTLVDLGVSFSVYGKPLTVELLEVLKEKGVNLLGPDQFGRTPLHYAAMDGNLACVKYLIKEGASVNAEDEQGFTPLFFVPPYHLSRSEKAVEMGQEVLDLDSQLEENMMMVSALLEGGADINHLNRDGVSYLEILFWNTALGMVTDRNHPKYYGNQTLANLGVQVVSADYMTFLLEKGADPSHWNQKDKAPFVWEIMQMVIEGRSRESGFTRFVLPQLLSACSDLSYRCPESGDLMLERGWDKLSYTTHQKIINKIGSLDPELCGKLILKTKNDSVLDLLASKGFTISPGQEMGFIEVALIYDSSELKKGLIEKGVLKIDPPSEFYESHTDSDDVVSESDDELSEADLFDKVAARAMRRN